VHGGLGSAVAEVIVKNNPVPMEFVGMKDSFGGSGNGYDLMLRFGMTWRDVYASALRVMERRERGTPTLRKVTDVAVFAE